MARNKIELTETIMIVLKNGERVLGLLQRYPERDHEYWYITTQDGSLVLVGDSSISHIMRPSEKMMESLEKAIKEAYEETVAEKTE